MKTQKETDWFENIYDKERNKLESYSLKIVKNNQLAQEAVQYSFMKLWEQDFKKIKSYVESWLFTVCKNKSLDLIKKQSIGLSFDVPDTKENKQKDIRELINFVSKENQEIMLMKFRDGYSYKEISQKTGKTINNIGVIIHREVQKLKKITGVDNE